MLWRDREIVALKSGSGREATPASQRMLPKVEKLSLLTRLGVSQPHRSLWTRTIAITTNTLTRIT